MSHIALMRLRQLDRPEDILRKYKPSELSVEQKYDGFKARAVRGRGGVKLYSRNGKDLTAKAPGIVRRLNKLMPKNSARLGEITYVVNGQQELGLVQSILHSASPARAAKQAKELGGRLEFVVYDALEEGGKDVTDLSLTKRRTFLKGIPSRGIVRRAKVYTWAKRKEAMRDSIQSGGEGIVIKVKAASYIYRKAGASEPFGQWWKHKVPGEKAHTEDVILLGYAKREKRLAFKMYQIDSAKKRVFVGYVSNLPRITEKAVQKMSDRGKAVVAEISHQERFPSGKFRHPGWIRLRPDKPLKSATMTRTKRGKMAKVKKNPAPRRKDHNVHVVEKKGDVLHLHTFSSKDFVQPSASAFQRGLTIQAENGEMRILHSDAELRRFLKKVPGHRIVRARTRKSNPRNSKVKDALAIEATRFKKFEEFASAYWNACARGLYWYPTDEKRFYIGEHERRLISGERFNVFCSPELALAGKNKGKKYVAELDVTRLPDGDIKVKRGQQGAEIKIVGAAGSIKVTRILEADKAQRSFKWQLSILPSSKEELRKVWEKAWEKRRKEVAKAKIRRQKEKEREAQRAAKKREESEKAEVREERRKERAAAKRKAAREAKGRRARKESEAKRAASKKTAKKKTAKKGKWKRVPTTKSNPGKAKPVRRRVASHINNPG